MAKTQESKVPMQDVEIPVSIIVKARTRISKDATDKTETDLTILLDDPAAIIRFAARGAKIAWQQLQRNAGVVEDGEAEVSIGELAKREGGGGFKATPDSIANRVTKMPLEEYKATLAKLGIDAKSIEKLAKAHSAK